MAVRQDKVQITIDFITDESRKFAKTLLDTKEFNKEIDTSKVKLAQYQKQLAAVGTDEAKRSEILAKIAAEEKKVATNMAAIAAEAKKVEGIDLTRLTPAQLTERAKQLAQAMRDIPQSAPQFRELETELARINGQLGTLRNTAKGIQADGAASGGAGGGFFGTVVGKATVAIAAVQAVFAAVQGLFQFVGQAFTAGDEAAKQDDALKSRIASTNAVANKSFQDLITQAEALADITLFDDDQVKRSQEVLLTFTNIRDEVFDETIPTLLDLSTTMKQDVSTSAVQVGKALNDPIKGITALSRIGVTFSEDQKKVIARLVETGDVAGAQRVILEELRREFGGSAQAAAAAGAGGYQQFVKRLGEIKETLGTGFIGLLDRLSPVINFVVEKFEKLAGAVTRTFAVPVSEKLREQQREFNALIGVLQNVNAGEETRKRAIDELQSKYPEYIGNLDLHKATEAQLNEVLKTGNNIFAQRIFLQSKDERLTDIARRREEAQQALFEAEKNLQAAQQGQDVTFGLSQQDEIAKFTNVVSGYKEQLRDILQEEEAFLSERDEFAKRFNLFPGGVLPTNTGGTPPPAAPGGGGDAEDGAEKLKKQLEVALAAIEADTKKRELILENFRIKDQIDEERYLEGLSAIQERGLEKQLAVYRSFGKAKENEALAIQNRLAEIEAGRRLRAIAPVETLATAPIGGVASNADNTAQRLEVQDVGEQALLTALKNKFEAALIAEQDYNLQKLELQRFFLAQEIDILKSATVPQVEEIKKRENEKRKIEEEIGKARLENDKRLEDIRVKALQEGLKASGELFSAVADMLSQDEKRKQKHAGVVKALQIANIQVNLAAEVSGIYANAQKSAIAVLLGPLAGNILATVQAAAAVVRAGVATAKIQSTKFARGTMLQFAQGRMGFFGGKPHSQGGTKGYFEDGTVIEVEKDEGFAIVNKYNAPLLRTLSSINSLGGKGVPYFQNGGALRFDTGGLPNINTSPLSATLAGSAQIQDTGAVQQMQQAASIMLEAAALFPRRVKADVVYTEIEDAGTQLTTVRDDAAL